MSLWKIIESGFTVKDPMLMVDNWHLLWREGLQNTLVDQSQLYTEVSSLYSVCLVALTETKAIQHFEFKATYSAANFVLLINQAGGLLLVIFLEPYDNPKLPSLVDCVSA